MAQEGVERRLAAILAADIVGYSRLVREDEEGTLAAVKSLFAEIFDPKITSHRGRIFKTMGDGVLADFSSVVEALRCGAEIQREVAKRNADRPDDLRVEFRLGINVGDVVIEGDDVHGDGVNVAARLEGLAEPGGICLSEDAYRQVANRIDFGFEDLGEQQLKNIDKPVRVYRVLLDPDASGTLLGAAKPKKKRWKWAALAACLVLGLGALAWFRPWATETQLSTSPLSAKASIAVLPFSNLSKDPEQEYFSDGITNDLITDLSKFHDLFVIASNSAFSYKGKAVQIQEVGRDLGVRYVLEGSVQRLGGRVRINVQLIDTANGRHLWAERYNEPVSDLFDLQDRITRRIVRTLAVRLTRLEQERAFAKSTRNLQAYDYVLRGRHHLRHAKRAENFEARKMFQKAIDLDPDYASAYAGLGVTYLNQVIYGWTVGPPQQAAITAHDSARRAIAIDGNNADGHTLLASVYLLRRQYDLALVESERAIALNPNDANSYAAQGKTLVWSGHPEGAIRALETALRFDPMMGEVSLTHLGLAYYLEGRFEDALKVLERGAGLNPDFAFGQTILAATYGKLGNREGAERAARAVRRLNPFFSTDQFGRLFRNPTSASMVVQGLRQAGLE